MPEYFSIFGPAENVYKLNYLFLLKHFYRDSFDLFKLK